jgi:hypothetical protein
MSGHIFHDLLKSDLPTAEVSKPDYILPSFWWRFCFPFILTLILHLFALKADKYLANHVSQIIKIKMATGIVEK